MKRNTAKIKRTQPIIVSRKVILATLSEEGYFFSSAMMRMGGKFQNLAKNGYWRAILLI